ncbi:MAG: hypothetical protein ABMA01_09395 [Chthoniobacteraceae bacterium]
MSANVSEETLRRHLRSHNTSVLAASGISLGIAVVGWAVLYGLAYWTTMFVAVITQGADAEPPTSFHWVFLSCAGILLVAALLDGWLFPDERAVDARPPVEHLTDVLLFIPRLSIAFWGNLTALVSLSDSCRQQAAALLDRLKTEGKFPLQELPFQIPDDKARARIITALSVAQLIDTRKSDGLTWLSLSSNAPDEFRGHALGFESGPDPMNDMPSANPRQPRNLLPGPRTGSDEMDANEDWPNRNP